MTESEKLSIRGFVTLALRPLEPVCCGPCCR